MDKREELIKIFSKDIREILKQVTVDFEQVQEIRLRVHAPLLMICSNREYYITREGNLSMRAEEAYLVTRDALKETLDYMSSYSLYAFEEEIKQGFITIQGGHRIGIAGKTITDGHGIRSMKFISFINVGLSHQVKGCAGTVLPYLYDRDMIFHTLIISPPRCGKTTLLRDIIRQVSNGSREHAGLTIGVIDERSEIGACYQGIPQNELGIRTDILDCCPKAQGMMMLIRAMSPDVVAVDEIGTGEDIRAIESVVNCGCKLLATVHGNSMEDMKQKPLLNRLVESHVFERYIVLDAKPHAGSVQAIFDGRGTTLYRREAFL